MSIAYSNLQWHDNMFSCHERVNHRLLINTIYFYQYLVIFLKSALTKVKINDLNVFSYAK